MSEIFTKEVILALVGGSSIGFIIQNIFELFNKRAMHKRELAKIMYVRKLDAAERGIAFYWAAYSQTEIMKSSLDVFQAAFLKMEESNIEIETIIKQLELAGEALMKIEQADIIDRNTMHLYFDINDADFWSEDDSVQLLEAISKVKHLDNHLEQLSEKLQESKTNQKEYASYLDKLKEITPTYIAQVKQLVALLNKNKDAHMEVVQKLRNHIKKMN